MTLHDDELAIEPATVRALVDRTLPDAAGLPLRRLAASGSTNAPFRLVTRLLPVPVPEVLAVGEPGFGYPEHWSVVRWIDGATPTGAATGAAGDALAADLAAVVTALGAAPVPDAALAENLLVRDGRLAALLDFGGLSVGDPTVDLIVAWDVLDAAAREAFRSAVGVDDETWLRGRAWALCLALMTFPYYGDTMPERCANRLAVARAVVADAVG